MGCFWPFPPPFLSLFSASHYLTVLFDFSKVHITDLTSSSFKSALACCRYMCVPNTSLKLDSTQGCHNPSISLLSLSLALSLSVLTWRTRCTARYNPDVTTNPSSTHDIATPKTSRGQTHTKTQPRARPYRNAAACCRVCLLTVQIQVVNAVMLSEPFYHPQVQQHQTIKEKGIASPHLQAHATP